MNPPFRLIFIQKNTQKNVDTRCFLLYNVLKFVNFFAVVIMINFLSNYIIMISCAVNLLGGIILSSGTALKVV